MAAAPISDTWRTLRDFQAAMDTVGAPVFIAGGTVLGLARHCHPHPRGGHVRGFRGSSEDLDFGLDRTFCDAHFDAIADALAKA